MKIAKAYSGTIYLGLREGYGEKIHNISEVYDVLQQYCNEIGLCVTVTETKFIYTHGNERGVIIGLINYPRFPSEEEDFKQTVLDLATKLKSHFNQHRLSTTINDKTYMIE